MTTDTRPSGQRVAALLQASVAYAVLAFLVAPIAVVVPLSFSSGSFFYYPLPGFSLRWYETYLTSPGWVDATIRSFIVAVATAILSTALGTAAAFVLVRQRIFARKAI